jgi:hypothetical protein
VTLFWDEQDEALKDLAKVCEAVKVLMPLRKTGPLPGRALAHRILGGDVAQLPVLARLLEKAGSPKAKAVCALLQREAKIAARDGYSRRVDVKLDPELERAREKAYKRPCPGCKHREGMRVQRVNKAGPNCGRIFQACENCDHFKWLGEPDPAHATPEPAEEAPVDEALEALRAGAGAGACPACPACGKARTANRVKKEGPNKGRLFYCCSDRRCDHFEWSSPAPAAPAPAPPGDAELERARRQSGPCPCGLARAVNRVRKEGPNKGRLFAKCDGCGAFEWL